MKTHFLEKEIPKCRTAAGRLNKAAVRRILHSTEPENLDDVESSAGSVSPEPPAPEKTVILLVSADVKLDTGLRFAAKGDKRTFITVDSLRDAQRTIQADTGAILLDLDLAGEPVWEAADGFLQKPEFPPVLLLTGQSDRDNVRMAINAGSLVDKTADPNFILRAVNKVLKAPQSAHAKRNALQRLALRWLKPLSWLAQRMPTHRNWGINE